MHIKRRKTRVIKIGSVSIGGHNPVAIQSMTKCKTSLVESVVAQIRELESVGCEIVRLAVKDRDDAVALKKIKSAVRIPVVADIHFDYRLAIAAIESGVDKIRLNPGNVFKPNEVRAVVSAAKQARIPIRVGLNSGSVRGSGDPVSNMIKSAREYIAMLEKMKFHDLVVSLKASDAYGTIQAYRAMARYTDYPFHLGVTATGLPFEGTIKSSVAIGALLLDGIGDTIRVSLTQESREEIKVAQALLKSLGVRNFGPEIISCPTCGRCEVNLVDIVRDLEKAFHKDARLTSPLKKPVTVAVMGCVVNGPGEAKHADLGIAFGKNEGLLFEKGKPVCKVAASRAVGVLVKEIKKII
jgi:(E)-4-hydroxy-3-methylbut-2-enyl-diphosphate synthase